MESMEGFTMEIILSIELDAFRGLGGLFRFVDNEKNISSGFNYRGDSKRNDFNNPNLTDRVINGNISHLPYLQCERMLRNNIR